MAICGNFFASCIPEGASDGKSAPSWQDSRTVHPKTGSLWQDMRAMHSKSPANSRLGIHRAKILPGRGAFRCTGPSNHTRRADLAIPRCSYFAHCPRLCGVERLFRRFAHMQLRAAPRSRARCSCCRARLRVRRARCPRVRCAYIPRRPPRGASAFALRRWVCPASPSTRLLSCAFASRRRALLIWLGFRMRPALASLSSRPRRGRNSGIVSFAAENMAL